MAPTGGESGGSPPRAALRRSLLLGGGLLAGWAVLLLVGGWLWLWWDWVPSSVARRLPGACPAEVRALLGEPDHVAVTTDIPGERWEYRRAWAAAEFRVDFDRAGKVYDWSYDR